ncbi:glycine cleavage system H protein [Deinobacterium chartae]|uniref:Glycine cleavage system H protein n=1 Tax=Deinobacterium chartae TaxID=521158 RepID=A0A841HZ34_9DEIO|nr:glycine cleavage system protein GcvH [Deinobacterium chartae]MBB6098657.1 glycine cleavage system H protein [Deinobacterium chartae]
MNTPQNLRYLKSHEWVRVDGNIATVGITDFAQDQLGDVVYVELPQVGRTVSAGESVAVVESVKTASDIYSPASGTVIEVNDDLEGSPERVNESPYEGGWLFKVELGDLHADLLDAAAYEAIAQDS